MKDKSDGFESSLSQRPLSLRQREEVQALLLAEGGRSPPRPSPTITDLHGKPKKRPEYPIGTVALYGPDDRTTTKIAAGVITTPTAEPIVQRWVASDVTTTPKVQEEMKEFFAEHGVKSVAVSEGNMGCPHEEGEDFLEGTDCPFCPFWAGKQGSNRRV
jgi:hypothetical protein